MNRRTTLMALGGALPLVLASRNVRAQSMPISVANWRSATLQYGTLAKQTSQFALLKSPNSYVRDFAQSEIEEQTAFGQALTATANPPPATLTPAQQAMLASVEQASGSEFDPLYLNIQLQGHQMLLQIQNELLADGLSYSMAAVQQASVARAFIQTHIVALTLLISNNQ